MASISAELRVGGHVFPLLRFTYEVHQSTDRRGRVVTKVRYGLVQILLDVPRTDFLKAWAADPAKRWAVDLVALDATSGQATETLHMNGAYCVFYREVFNAGDIHTGSYVLHADLSDPDGFTLTAGGPAAYVAPAARDHGVAPPSPVAPALARGAEKRGAAQPNNPMNPARMALWVGYLERRGVRFLVGTPEAQLKLFDHRADGLYSAGQVSKTIFLHDPPGTATFFEEAFHALQDLRHHPQRKVLENGEEVDAWEYDAKSALLTHSGKLGLSYEEHIETEKQLQEVIDGTYGDH